MKTIADFDSELEVMQREFQLLHGKIELCKMERNFALAQAAKDAARTAPVASYQMSEWNNDGHRNDNFSIEEKLA